MTVSTLTTLTEIAQDVLTVAEDALADTTAGVPERSYVSPAEPTFDCCPQLTVHVAGLQEAATFPTAPALAPGIRRKVGSVIQVPYVITAIRCAPVPDESGNPPEVTEIEAAAIEVQEDGWALWNGIRDAINCGTIFEDCLGVIFDGGTPIREQGGCVGWRFVIRAPIEGIPQECGS